MGGRHANEPVQKTAEVSAVGSQTTNVHFASSSHSAIATGCKAEWAVFSLRGVL